MSTARIRWNRSDDGNAISKCGRYEIQPRFCGGCSASCYDLIYREPGQPSRRLFSFVDTQRECKAFAQAHADSIGGGE